jgi:hypothetical protein
MARERVIESYLTELGRELRLPPRLKRRVLAEIEDHLREAAATSDPRAAIDAFGAPREVAKGFGRDLAAHRARRSAIAAAIALGAFALVFTLATQVTTFADGPFMANPYLPLGWIAVQLGFVAGSLTALRAWLGTRSTARLAYVNRGAAITIAAAGVSTGLALLGYALGSGDTSTTAGAGLLAATVAAFLAALASGAVAATAIAQANRAGIDVPADADIWDDLAEASERLGVANAAKPLLAAVDPRRRPLRLCLVVAVGAGLAVAATHLVAEGPPPAPEFLRGIEAGLILLAIEALAVAACFRVFGRFLGIRPRQLAESPPVSS